MASSLHFRLNTLLLVLLVVMAGAIIALLASRAYGGPLDPPAAPTSTMKTLDEIPNSWGRLLDSTNGGAGGFGQPPAGCNSDRFKCVLAYCPGSPACVYVYPAVLDEETGLVWERAPSGSSGTWGLALTRCSNLGLGTRLGWRLPTITELESLLDSDTNLLPAGHPFAVGASGTFWSHSPYYQGSPDRWFMQLGALPFSQGASTSSSRAWCVRGPGWDDEPS